MFTPPLVSYSAFFRSEIPMAAIPRLQLLVLFVILLLISLFISSSADADGGLSPVLSPSSAQSHIHTYPPALFATILSTLGFQELSTATITGNLSATTPLTIFAPTDASLLSCHACSIPLLIQELSLSGLYPLRFLRNLIFGTKIETLAPDRCLTITTGDKDKIFVNGVEISSPDLFNNGLLIIHGLQGFVSHLSPLSCNVEHMTSLSFPSAVSSSLPPSFHSITRLMLKDAIVRLQATGYTAVSLALRFKYVELSDLRAMTIFALEDTEIFANGGYAYLSSFRYHVVPNRRLIAAELVKLPSSTYLPTLDAGNSLVVTTAGGGGPSLPMKINYVKISTIDVLHNSRIVVHGVSSPFPHMHHHLPLGYGKTQQSNSNCDDFDWIRGICVAEVEGPSSLHSTVTAEGHQGL